MGDIGNLKELLRSASEKNQLQIIPQLVSSGETGLTSLMEWMSDRGSQPANIAMGKAYQALYSANTPQTQKFLAANFPNGIVPLKSERGIDYQPLQELLAQQDFQAADILTIQKLCALAGEAAVKRKWLYFTEVENFPNTDLYTLDRLWLIHSEGKFGFSVQRKIWLSVGKDFAQLWSKIGWKSDNNWTRYPKEFTWNLDAPPGHLPLSNQLRGVRVIAAIFAHPVWSQTSI
ncbi:MAG: GUN4 N-terminal ARM-like repeat domain-containing protein [Pleurocapsa sp.]